MFYLLSFASVLSLFCHQVIKIPCHFDAFIGRGDIPGPTRVVEGWGVTVTVATGIMIESVDG
jgi:hypothetical protein